MWLVATVSVGVVGTAGVAWGVPAITQSTESVTNEHSEEQGLTGLWTGTSNSTTKRGTDDLTIGYTMRGDFWFRINEEGEVSGHASAVYQPTFKSDGLDAKINMAKSAAQGVAGMIPGAGLGLVKSALETAGSTGLAGIIGVKGTYKDPQPVRSGEITGHVDQSTNAIHIEWVDESQAEAIPVEVTLDYVKGSEHISDEELSIWSPWREGAVVSEGSAGRLAVSDTEESSNEDDLSATAVQHWSAQRVGPLDGDPPESP